MHTLAYDFVLHYTQSSAFARICTKIARKVAYEQHALKSGPTGKKPDWGLFPVGSGYKL